jgi:radical SAM superfamily enzyme YgiQ (UPF0313 family)
MVKRVLLVSCYELGRQPAGVARALAALERAGFDATVQDVSVESLSADAVRAAELVAISAPMHTALQLGVRVAARVREENASARIAFFGLYAALNREHLLALHCDFVLGESADGLVDLAAGRVPAAELPRTRDATVPSRAALPPLQRYAQLEVCGGERRLVASVEASLGCKHLCKHCPIPPVYGGRFVAVPAEAVLADVEQQVSRGAQHVSFGDPDFLNGPTHALRVARAIHERWPELTFDATIKIEHLLQHGALLPELVRYGLLFVTSAVESLNDRVLRALDKGHTAADVPLALQRVRDAGAELRPTLLPYTPWTEPGDLPALFEFAVEHELVDAIDPVQYTLRLLLPPGSLLLEGSPPWLRPFDPQSFSWRWEHPDPQVDALWRESSRAVHAGAGFDELYALVAKSPRRRDARQRRPIPRLTEPWFC